MSQENTRFPVLGVDIAFRPSADMERVRRAVSLVEERFTDQKQRSRGVQSKDILLTYMALGLADDLLQSKIKLDAAQNRIAAMLSKIEKSIQGQ